MRRAHTPMKMHRFNVRAHIDACTDTQLDTDLQTCTRMDAQTCTCTRARMTHTPQLTHACTYAHISTHISAHLLPLPTLIFIDYKAHMTIARQHPIAGCACSFLERDGQLKWAVVGGKSAQSSILNSKISRHFPGHISSSQSILHRPRPRRTTGAKEKTEKAIGHARACA